jgi:hypothetical protein
MQPHTRDVIAEPSARAHTHTHTHAHTHTHTHTQVAFQLTWRRAPCARFNVRGADMQVSCQCVNLKVTTTALGFCGDLSHACSGARSLPLSTGASRAYQGPGAASDTKTSPKSSNMAMLLGVTSSRGEVLSQ